MKTRNSQKNPKEARRRAAPKGRAPAADHSSKGAKLIAAELDALGVTYSKEVRFNDCRAVQALPAAARALPFDFQVVVKDKVGLVEFDGAQHFAPSSLYHKSPEDFQREQDHDRVKTQYAFERGIPLLRLAYDLSDDAVREKIREFIERLRRGERGVLVASAKPALYDYLKPAAHREGCVIL
jgi:hypothetical protein